MGRRWVVVGAGGMLGKEVVTSLAELGEEVVGLGRSQVDITDPVACAAAVSGADVVVNCAAWTAVDAAEEEEPAAFRTNAVGPAVLARASTGAGARLVHVSTDYVFAGDAVEPYEEDAVLGPRSAYGRTKAAGEWAVQASGGDHLVVRTAWLYGDGPCFPRTMARLLARPEGVDVVDDQTGQPTWTRDVAALVHRLVVAGAGRGTYHATSSGRGTWFDLARAVAESAGADPQLVRPTSSDAFVRPAERPSWSVLGHGATHRAGVEPIGPWRERWRVASSSVLGVG